MPAKKTAPKPAAVAAKPVAPKRPSTKLVKHEPTRPKVTKPKAVKPKVVPPKAINPWPEVRPLPATPVQAFAAVPAPVDPCEGCDCEVPCEAKPTVKLTLLQRILTWLGVRA